MFAWLGTLKTPKALSSEIFRKNSLTPFLLICPTVTTMNNVLITLSAARLVSVFSQGTALSPLRWTGDGPGTDRNH